jgi:hypothetical protein
MRAVCSLVLVLGACTRPDPFVLCHNANCVAPDTSRDDTIDALSESLALTYDGRPALDGTEIDTFWDGTGSRCLFAHDLTQNNPLPALEPARLISDYLATTPVVSWHGERFYMLIEMKGFVGDSISDMHTPEQRVQHAECVLDIVDTIAVGARAGGHPVSIGFIATRPPILETLVARPRWTAYAGDPDIKLLAVGDEFAPYSSTVAHLSDYTVKLDAVEFHPDYMTAEKRETYRSLGIDLVQWQFITTEEALDSVKRWEPEYVLANEALLMRRWIEN